MMSSVGRTGWMLTTLLLAAPVGAESTALKERAVESIDRQRPQLIELSDQVWRFAETALREVQSSRLLADHAESHGFRVERGVAELPTAFIASFGQGRPVIGIMGEYDALPGISQKAVPSKEPLVPGGAGHGCGHNLFGAASLGAAIAVKELIEDVDVALAWHPASEIEADTDSSQAMVDLFVDEGRRRAIRREFEDKTRGVTYRGYLADGPPPLPR